MSKAMRGRSVDTIFVLIVFSIFALSILMVLMLGASVYRNINDISNEGQHEHTVLSYIWTKTKNYDNADSISAGDFKGIPALFIDEKIGEENFRTVIYSFDGWLFELYSEVTLEFSPGDGIRIMQIENLNFKETSNGLIEVTANEKTFLFTPRSGMNIEWTG